MPNKTLSQRLKEKNWSKKEIEQAIKIISHSKRRKNKIVKLIDRFIYWVVLLVMIFGNLVISIILVPFLLALRSAQLYLVVITLGMAFGLFFDLLIRDIDDLEKKHYIIAALFIPALAAIDVFYMTQFANFLEGLMKIENLHNPLLAGIAYALAFILPYCTGRLVSNFKKGW